MRINPDGLACESVPIASATFGCPRGVCSNPGDQGVDINVPNSNAGASTSIILKQTKADVDAMKRRLDQLEARVNRIPANRWSIDDKKMIRDKQKKVNSGWNFA